MELVPLTDPAPKVALRKESVDRNGMEINGVSYDVWSLSARRAWIEIGRHGHFKFLRASLSARRAWIEISIDDLEPSTTRRVALRKESVDRNLHYRRVNLFRFKVALRKESVDRNATTLLVYLALIRRSPQGERG